MPIRRCEAKGRSGSLRESATGASCRRALVLGLICSALAAVGWAMYSRGLTEPRRLSADTLSRSQQLVSLGGRSVASIVALPDRDLVAVDLAHQRVLLLRAGAVSDSFGPDTPWSANPWHVTALGSWDDEALIFDSRSGRLLGARMLHGGADWEVTERLFVEPPVYSMCRLRDHLVLGGYRRGVVARLLRWSTREVHGFGRGFGRDDVERGVFGRVLVACVPALSLAVIASPMLGQVRAMRTDGREVWTATLPRFDAVHYRRTPSGVAFRHSSEGADVIRSIGVVGAHVIVNVVRVSPDESVGPNESNVRGLRQFVLDPRTGSLVASGSGLPELLFDADGGGAIGLSVSRSAVVRVPLTDWVLGGK